MVTKLCFFNPHYFPATSLFPAFLFQNRKPSRVSLSTTTATCVCFLQYTSSTKAQHTDPNPISYGPSIHKGTNPSRSSSSPLNHNPTPTQQSAEDGTLFDEESFTRVFDISALRVPAQDCFTLENRLRGHLLNWPRIRNIARVAGDEVDPKIAHMLEGSSGPEDGDEDDSLVSLHRRIYGKDEGDGGVLSPVLYRDKLVKTFNSRGFEKFRNLAKLSRPPRRRKGKGASEEGSVREKGSRKSDFAVVEVVEEDEEEEGLEDLIGVEFRRPKWKGSTRLLLLDEEYAGKSVEELPEAVKVVFGEYVRKKTAMTIELVKCKLTLFYSYWSMNEILETLLPQGATVPSSFEIVGHIAHLNLRDEHVPFKELIAKVVLDKNKPKIKTVVNKIDSIQNDFRTMELEVLAGNHSLVTTVVENGTRFHVDLASVYWNSRLGTERLRLISGFTRKDVVCDVFSGVGPIAISAAKKVKRVYANDLNPSAVEYLERNCVLNNLERKIQVFNMDGRRFIEAMFASDKAQSITQVVMNLPNSAAEFLDSFRGIYRDKPKDIVYSLPTIHVYGFSKAQDPEFEFHERIRIALKEVAVNVSMHRVRLVAPGKWMLCASFILPERVAFASRRGSSE